VVDVAGFARPFAAGEAHSEMATMAERVWDVAGSTILALLDEHKDYELVITGHSLGAGTASLLNVLCHANRRALVRGRNVRCFCFAAPPTFAPLEAAPEAVRACTSYIHERDVVPFLSVDAIRHLCRCINAVEAQSLSWAERIRLMIGYTTPSPALQAAIVEANASRLEPKTGAPVLYIPAANNVWMQEMAATDQYNAQICDSTKLANLGILIDSKMLEDHFPSRYEHALHNLGVKN
jgi:Lipase (class 3)